MKPTLKAPGTKRLKLNFDKPLLILLNFCFHIQVAPLHQGATRPGVPRGRQELESAGPQLRAARLLLLGRGQPHGRGLHSFTSQLNLSALYGIGGARNRCVARVTGMLWGVSGV